MTVRADLTFPLATRHSSLATPSSKATSVRANLTFPPLAKGGVGGVGREPRTRRIPWGNPSIWRCAVHPPYPPFARGERAAAGDRLPECPPWPPRLHGHRRPGGPLPDRPLRHGPPDGHAAGSRGRPAGGVPAESRPDRHGTRALRSDAAFPADDRRARSDRSSGRGGLARSLEDPAGGVRPCRFPGTLGGDRDSAARGTGSG